MEKQALISQLEQHKLIVIIRGIYGETLEKTVEALYLGGIRFAEVTFRADGKPSDLEIAAEIRNLSEKFKGRMHIGAGTVLTERQVLLAKRAGAEFIISPDTNKKVIRRTVKSGLLSIPGALTPTEATEAHRAGADFVKLFPAGQVPASYLKDIALPLSHIRFLAVAGVTAENIKSYLDAGAYGAGVSGGIVNKKLIEEGKFEEITALAQKYLAAAGVTVE